MTFGRTVKVALIVLVVVAALATSARAGDPKWEYRAVPDKPPEKPLHLKANASAGLVWAAGNSQSLGFSGNGLFQLKYYNNQWEAFGQGAYVATGVSKYGAGGPITGSTTSTQMWLWRARYDRFFLERNTVFASFQMSGDRPAGYWWRIEPQAGYARLFFQSIHQLLKGEVGYDYTLEHRAGVLPAGSPRNVEFHSLRLYGYYENKFTPYASFTEGCELLWALNDLDSVRVNSLTSLSSTISKRVALKLNFTVKFNNRPPPRPTNLVDPATMMPFVPAPNDTTLDKVDTLLEAVVAVTLL
jgi:putative salt-induced outer membrane protein YdiY